ncbi:NifU family protein [Faecalibaculum rodentium]|uniref:NifU family protein n=1 Tax=Faecalibaculum rodentium TaxID=1702221 RepID=UPI00256EE61B|nr:NifU family protein [Faecalibaculum rodentium]
MKAAQDLEAAAGLKPSESEPHELTEPTAQVLEEQVEEVLEKIRPYIQHDGGDIELLGVDENNIVYVSFIGACAGCAMAGEDFSGGVKLLLLDEVPAIRDVVLIG